MAPSVDRISVRENEALIRFTYQDMMSYSGPVSPAGVALAFKAMELAFATVDPSGSLQRREVVITTAFRGPGARDGFELVTRALTDGRYHIDASLERPERGPTLEQFVFRIAYRTRQVTMAVAPGYVTDEFIALARSPQLSDDQALRFAQLKHESAELIMASKARDIFEIDS